MITQTPHTHTHIYTNTHINSMHYQHRQHYSLLYLHTYTCTFFYCRLIFFLSLSSQVHYLESQIHPLSSWMNKVLSSLNQSDPVHGDIATVHELIDAHEVSLLSYTENIQVETRERRRENIGRRRGWGEAMSIHGY